MAITYQPDKFDEWIDSLQLSDAESTELAAVAKRAMQAMDQAGYDVQDGRRVILLNDEIRRAATEIIRRRENRG